MLLLQAACYGRMSNSLMVEHYAYVPSVPPFTRHPVPDTKHANGWTEEQLKDTLPPVKIVINYIDFLKGFESALQYQVY